MFAAKNELFTRPSGYTISRSVRLRSSASAYFNRTPAGAGTSNKTFTYSAWVKRGSLGSIQNLISSPNTGNSDSLRFSAADQLEYNWQDTVIGQVTTTQVFRDPSAWYHIMFAMDTTQATASNRFKLYINGVQVTAFATANYPAQNTVVNNTAAVATKLGQYANSSAQSFDGYMTEINFIDGQALTPSSFGETNSITGVWQPIKYSGTYGTNGFYLNFSDNSSNTATTIGKDYSGNGNNWTPNNISVTSGVTYDSMIDSPTVSASSSNYAVINPLKVIGSVAGGNLNGTTTGTSGVAGYWFSTIGVTSGKWYFETTIGTLATNSYVGVYGDPNNAATDYAEYQLNGGTWFTTVGGSGSFSATATTNDVLGVAVDITSGTFQIYKNGTSLGTITGITFTGKTWFFGALTNAAVSSAWSFNFGQRPFSYTPPSGFNALNTFNLPTPTIANGGQNMNAVLWTGNTTTLGVTQAITGLGFQPDFVWAKTRNQTFGHYLYDALRGVGASGSLLQSNSTNAQATNGEMNSFDSNGFTVKYVDTLVLNWSSSNNVGWAWKAGNSSSSNTNGSITSTVSVNATAGFSVVTFTTPSSGQFTVGHGLGVTPSMVIVKSRTTAGSAWFVYHSATNPSNTGYLVLNTTSALATYSTMWGASGMTSTTLGLTVGGATYASDNEVAYCFSAVAGYSAFGSYTGNGSSDGPFVYLGFRPRFIMVKRTDASNFWLMMDSSRSTYNVMGLGLLANASDAEFSWSPSQDFLSNGFKVRTSDVAQNASGGTYIYMAFAENPFRISLAR